MQFPKPNYNSLYLSCINLLPLTTGMGGGMMRGGMGGGMMGGGMGGGMMGGMGGGMGGKRRKYNSFIY